MLNTINYHQAWYINQEIVMNKTGEIIPDEIRRLSRLIMRQVFKRMKKPNLSHISMWLDARAGSLSKPIKATQNGKVAHWAKMSTLIPRKTINVPLLGYDYHNNRQGIIANGIQVNLNEHGQLSFGVVTDIGEKCEKSRNEYQGEGIIGLDFGLKTMFATSEGQLLGQNFIKQLKKYDTLIQMISKKQQKQGKKPRDSKRYCKLVQKNQRTN
jgi:putative transposase